MFLVSGTLLGCIRENRLLTNDKDIDVGVWDNVLEFKIVEIITSSGQFVMRKSRSKQIIRLRHANGISIDIFYHFREKDDYWHGGVKMIWHNSPFELVKRDFLGDKFLVPKDHDKYLTENYGDWRTPKTAFDAVFDTPNGEVKCASEMAIHLFKKLGPNYRRKKWPRVKVLLAQLKEYGEEDFVKKFEQFLPK